MLASDPNTLKDYYDVLIIGSGYGGAITAARLGYANSRARGGLSIAIFERGKEHPTGSFPATAGEFAGLLKSQITPLGLFEFVLSDDFSVVQGNGIGGTSLVNGCVCIIPDREAFDLGWPRAIRDDGDFPMEQYYKRALAMLDAVPYADTVPALPKVGIFKQMSESMGGTDFHALHLSISNETRTTKYGVVRRPCVNCSSCISGCNYDAKNTLDKNYLPMAKHFGVEMYQRMEVDTFQKLPGDQGYLLSVKYRKGPSGRQVEWKQIRAKRLILAAGSLGSTGIMLRSQSPQLQFSKHVGEHFSGNGDFFALAYNMDQVPNFNGWTTTVPEEFQLRGGPTITTVFKVNANGPIKQRLTFEEASMPAPFVETMRNLAFAAASGQPWKFLNTPSKVSRWYKDRDRNNTGAINSSLLYLGMGFDSANGKIRVKPGGDVYIDWPDAAEDEVFKLLAPLTVQGAEAMGGDQFPNPMIRLNLPIPAAPPYVQKPMTGHPIGGCATGENVDQAVVDDRGRVFDGNGGYHEGLYVIDGSIFPNAIGVNVLLTISAFAERASEFLREEMDLPPFNPAEEWDDR